MSDEFLTPEEVARILKISKYTVYEKVKKGELPATRIGRRMRIKQSDLEAFVSVDTDNVSIEPVLGVQKPIRFFGSHDLSLEVLMNFLSIHFGEKMHAGYIGSMEGLMQLYFGQADVVGCHLFDEESGEYNLPFIKRILPNEKIKLVSFVKRNIGWIVPKGNPKNLHSWEDIIRKDLKIVNRQKGSGTRILLDYKLNQFAVNADTIKGHEIIEHTHVGAATHVLRGQADTVLGTESAARNLQLDFVLLEKESYDFVMTEEFFTSLQGVNFIQCLISPALKEQIQKLGGYDCLEIGKSRLE